MSRSIPTRFRCLLRSLACALAAIAVSCGEAPPPSPSDDVVRPVEMTTVGAGEFDAGLRFPGVVRAAERADLAFDVAGRVVELSVREGRRVEAGQLVARLESETALLQLGAAQAQYDNAKVEHERARKLWDEGIIARAELDRKRTALDVARSTLASARERLDDTRLVAPFSGRITRKYVERFQNVQAKEPIVSLQDLDRLEIVIHVPERIVRGAPRRAAAHAIFDEAPGERFPVRLTSFAAEADPTTQTYEAVLSLTKPSDFNVLPGMPVTVVPETAPEGSDETPPLSVPLRAVVSKGDDAPFVWVVAPEDGEVARRLLRIGEVSGTRIAVLEGLEPGERIAVSGVHHLRAGMRVRPLER